MSSFELLFLLACIWTIHFMLYIMVCLFLLLLNNLIVHAKMKTSQPQHRRNNPSFSSYILDAIYDSLDDDVSSSKGTRCDAPFITKIKPITTTAPSVVLTRHDSIRCDPCYLSNRQLVPTKKKLSIITGTSSNKKQRSPSVMSLSSSSSSPSSPGAKIAAFVNSLFNASSRHKKQKVSTPPASYTSCLSKTTLTSRSSVRFSDLDRKERRRILMEELLKEIDFMENESDDDLFELEIIKKNKKFSYTSMDELPVYGTTDLELNCAIAKSAGCVKPYL